VSSDAKGKGQLVVPDFSMLGPSDKLRLIVTRPIAQAMPWVEALRKHGFEAHALPLIDILPATDPKPLHEAWRALPQTALAMFVSANAVKYFFVNKPQDVDWPLSALAASTGPGTTAALQQAGLRGAMIVEPLAGAGYDSEALWARLSPRNWGGSKVLIVRGEEGRDWLADRFRQGGATVTAVAAYRRLAPVLTPETKAVLARAIAYPGEFCWFFSSSEAIGHLAALAPTADWSHTRALVTHLRIAQAARVAGFGDVVLVDPQPQAVVGAMRQMQHMPRLA
jgi:uroporphyrinogen-III synthase